RPLTDFGGKTSIFSHPVYLFLREFSLQDFRGGSVWLILRGCEFRVFVRNPDEFSCMGRNKAAAIPGKI
ncbi:hypothetical protein, partial [Escherichia coli]